MRRLLRFLLAALLLVISMPFIVLGAYTATIIDWWPRRTLSSEELKRIVVTRQHVAHQMFQLGRIPTHEEFRARAYQASLEARLDGVEINYWPSTAPGSSAYDLCFWDGKTTITWHSTSRDSNVDDIDSLTGLPSGRRGEELLLLLSLGGTLLLTSCLIAPAERTPSQARSTTSS